MGKGHCNTEAEQDVICCSFERILETLSNRNSENISRTEWWTGTEAREKYAGGNIVDGKKKRSRTERKPYPAILKLMFKVNDAIFRNISSNNSLSAADWVALLKEHPEYSSYCFSDTMDSFRAVDWLELIRAHREPFMNLCKKHHGLHKFYSSEMADLIIDFPEIAEECLLYRMRPKDWRRVVEIHPEILSLYTRQRLHSRKSVFNLNAFIQTLEAVPRETWKFVDWMQFINDGCEEWKKLLAKFPWLGPCFGKKDLPDDLIEAMDMIIRDGSYDSQKYVWTTWKDKKIRFSEQELNYNEMEFFERIRNYPELEKVSQIFYMITYWFGERFSSIEQRIEAVKKYHKTYPFIGNLFLWGNFTWKDWNKYLTEDYDVFINLCFKYFLRWYDESLGNMEDSLLRKNSPGNLDEHIARFKEMRKAEEAEKAAIKARRAERKRRKLRGY